MGYGIGALLDLGDYSLQCRHNEYEDVSNHQRPDCLPNLLFSRRSKITSKLRITGLCEGNSPVTGEFPAQRASIAENVSIWWRHHVNRQMGEWVIQSKQSVNQYWLDSRDVIMSAIVSQITGVSIVYSAGFFFSGRSKKASKLRVTGLCGGNSRVTGEFPAQRASNAENVTISWRHHVGDEINLNIKSNFNIWFQSMY